MDGPDGKLGMSDVWDGFICTCSQAKIIRKRKTIQNSINAVKHVTTERNETCVLIRNSKTNYEIRKKKVSEKKLERFERKREKLPVRLDEIRYEKPLLNSTIGNVRCDILDEKNVCVQKFKI